MTLPERSAKVRLTPGATVALVQPPFEDFYHTEVRQIPLGLLSLAAVLQRYRLVLLDLRYGQRHPVSWPAALRELAVYYRHRDVSPFGLYKNYYRFGLLPPDILRRLPEDCAVFLIAAMFTPYADTVVELIRLIRQARPAAWIVIGGSHASIGYEEMLAAGADFVIRGEGELALPQLLSELERETPGLTQIPNLVARCGTQLMVNPQQTIVDPDQLPYPLYDLTGLPVYRFRGKNHAMLIASRGCPHRCRFCSVHQTMGTRYRLRSVANVLGEVALRLEQGFRSFDFEDDHFGGDRQWLNALMDGLIERFSGYQIELAAMNGITASNLDENILRKMKRAGFSAINLALVTPSPQQQARYGRPVDTAGLFQIIAAARRSGLWVTTYLIIGMPGESAADNLGHILQLASWPTLTGPSLFYLTPGTPLYEELQRDRVLPEASICFRSSAFPFQRSDFTRREAMTLFRICRIINFVKGRIDEGCLPAGFEVDNEIVQVPPGLSGREVQHRLGTTLLNLFRKSGVLYGTDGRTPQGYRLYREHCADHLLTGFRKLRIEVAGIRSNARIPDLWGLES